LNTPPITGRDYTANSVAQSSCDRVRKNNWVGRWSFTWR
jgi:hypothetical protein